MKEQIIEVTIDENGDIVAETKGMQGKVCVTELNFILEGVSGKREIKNTSDYYKTKKPQQTVRRGK